MNIGGFILSNQNQVPFHLFLLIEYILFHSEIGCEYCFMLTFTLHRLVTMWHNYTKHKALQLFILFYQTGYERSQISQ